MIPYYSDAHEPYCAMGIRRIKAVVDYEQAVLDFGDPA